MPFWGRTRLPAWDLPLSPPGAPSCTEPPAHPLSVAEWEQRPEQRPGLAAPVPRAAEALPVPVGRGAAQFTSSSAQSCFPPPRHRRQKHLTPHCVPASAPEPSLRPAGQLLLSACDLTAMCLLLTFPLDLVLDFFAVIVVINL